MKILQIISLLLLVTVLCGCSWRSYFYIINKTSGNISITYTLNAAITSDYDYALADEVKFNHLTTKYSADSTNSTDDDKDSIVESFTQEYSQQRSSGKAVYSVTLRPQTAMCGGRGLNNFTYSQTEKRHRMFTNVDKMIIIRFDTKDTVTLTPDLLTDFAKPLGKHDIALIFN